MRISIWNFLMLFCLVFISHAQTKTNEEGSYLSVSKGQKIKLNLLQDNKYELVYYYGKYEMKGDSLEFISNPKSENAFDLSFKNDKKAKKIKVKFLDPYYYSFYIGTQKESEAVEYQRISDIKYKVNPNEDKQDVEFEIDRTNYLYLVFEQYEGDSKLSKFALPKDVSEITIQYQLDVLSDLKISGFFDTKKKELVIAEKSGKNPLVFRNEKDMPTQPEKVSKVIPLEEKTISNWSYPGKEALITDDFGYGAVDSTATVVESYPVSNFSFKFKIESTLKSAISATKDKFLVVYADSKNKAGKEEFDTFIKDLEVTTSYTMYDSYKPEFDLFNYYLASENDKKWLKANKITDDPGIIILNGDGVILATAKSTLSDKKSQFVYYDDFNKRLKKADALQHFDQVIKNKKTSNADLLLAFNKAASVDLPYDYDTVGDELNPADFKFKKNSLDKREVLQSWNKLVTAHQKDTKPNMALVETIVREISNRGFYKLFFNEDKALNDTDFLAIDYLIKHYDAINQSRLELNNKQGETYGYKNLNSDIAVALDQNISNSLSDLSSGAANKAKTISVYKKLIASGKGGFEIYKNYLDFLSIEAETSGNDSEYIKEFDSYFTNYLSSDKLNPIERLDEIYAELDPYSDFAYNGWKTFKLYNSDLANNTAWKVVLNPQNSNFLKKAISWSEYSLTVSKNNPYYLDTLSQLYYKDGQKEKAIATQEKAIQFSGTVLEEETLNDMKEALTKMKNGTY